jgi:hypothetical protein
MTPQLGALLMLAIQMTLEESFMLLESSITLLENIYIAGITHNNHCL